MAIRQISIEGYRSLQKVELELSSQINLITGPNGSGKSNIYKAIRLIAQTPRGRFAESLAKEGGMPSIMWAGERRRANFNKEETRLQLAVETDAFSYSLACGFPPNIPPSMFALDPEIKEEFVWLGQKRRPSTTVLERKQNTAFITDVEGNRQSYPFCLNFSESVLSQLKDPHKYPEIMSLALELSNWRFYHNFNTNEDSIIRYPQVCTRTPVIADDGNDLAAALQTILEIGDEERLHYFIEMAFPGSRLIIRDSYGNANFDVLFEMHGILRPLTIREFSDGTIRYLCLLAALLSPRPPSVMVLNEPEMSLHPELIEPLALLITEASLNSQVIITTHSALLQKYLLQQELEVKIINLYMNKFGTSINSDIDIKKDE
ncbi:AAA family ATPase [Aquella oligotrophica]|nr:AAA family ATPase [Aquella oligotrophica]